MSDAEVFEEWCVAWARGALHALKPGAHLAAFGGSRTWHRMVRGIERAGFEVGDQIAWLYSSGMPKSMDLGMRSTSATGSCARTGSCSSPTAMECSAPRAGSCSTATRSARTRNSGKAGARVCGRRSSRLSSAANRWWTATGTSTAPDARPPDPQRRAGRGNARNGCRPGGGMANHDGSVNEHPEANTGATTEHPPADLLAWQALIALAEADPEAPLTVSGPVRARLTQLLQAADVEITVPDPQHPESTRLQTWPARRMVRT